MASFPWVLTYAQDTCGRGSCTQTAQNSAMINSSWYSGQMWDHVFPGNAVFIYIFLFSLNIKIQSYEA